MNKIYVFLGSFIFVISSWAIAEEVELLDAYLEDLPSTANSQNLDSGAIVGQPVEVVVDENRQSHEVAQSQMVKYQKIKTSDSSEFYEEVAVNSTANVTEASNNATEPKASSSVIMSTDVVMSNQAPSEVTEDFEVIELEPDEGEIKVIEASENQAPHTTVKSGSSFCQQNPYARECLLSKYLSLCKKDPQSVACKSELQKFDRFCEAFPRAYKCKKARMAASCKRNPEMDECKTYTQRYCQKFPNAIFCNYN